MGPDAGGLPADLSFLDPGGEVAELTAGPDRSATPIGPVERWPACLRAAAGIGLSSRHGSAARCLPAVRPLEVGGDWYDVVRLDGGVLGLVVGDCAATVVVRLRGAVQALLPRAASPGEVLGEFASRIPGARCATVFCALVDQEGGTVRHSGAGHPPALLVGPDGDALLPAAGGADDVALLVCRHPAPFTRSLAADPTLLAPLRRELRRWLAATGLDGEGVDDVLLAVCEACTNSIEHAYRADARCVVDLRLHLDAGCLHVVVRDTGRWKPVGDGPTTRGRGVAMMRAMMDDVDVDTGAGGTTVTMRKRLHGGR